VREFFLEMTREQALRETSRTQVSVVLGSYNRRVFLQQAIESIRQSSGDLTFEIVVVDGGSTDGSIEWLSKQKDIITIVQHNRGSWNGKSVERRSWGYFMNLGFKAAQGQFVLMLSDDCLIHKDSMQLGVKFFRQLRSEGRAVGAVPFYWRNWPEMRNYWVGKILGGNYNVNHGLYLKEALERVNYVDEASFAFYYADGDLCLRMIRAGYEIIPCHESFVEHYSHANDTVRSSNNAWEPHDRKAYLSKWRGTFYAEGDEMGGWEFIDGPPEGDRLARRHWSRVNAVHGIRTFPEKTVRLIAGGIRRKIAQVFKGNGRHEAEDGS
jgi:GT2 family glycosyltransferase